MASFNSTHYIYYNGLCLSNNRFQTTSLNWRDASNRELDILSDETTTGTTILDIKDGAKFVRIEGGVTYTSSSQEADEMESMRREINRIFKGSESTLRVVQRSKTITLFNTDVTTGWSTSDDATAISTDSEILLTGTNKSLQVTVDVSNSANDYATITHSTLSLPSALDLTTFSGGFDIPFYTEDILYISSIKLRIGDDSSNYYEIEESLASGRQALQNGYNILSFDIEDKTETGTVTSSTPDFIEIEVVYTENAEDFTFNIGRSYSFENDFSINYIDCELTSGVEFNYSDALQGEYSNYFSAELICPLGYGESSFLRQDFTTTVTALQEDQSFTYKGSKGALPVSNLSLDSSLSNVTDITIQSLDTGKSISINDQTFSDGDQLQFNFEQKQVTLNSAPVYFTGQTEDFFVYGKNRVQLNIGQSSAQTLIQTRYTSPTRGSIGGTRAQSFDSGLGGTVTFGLIVLEAVVDYSIAASGAPAYMGIYEDNAGEPGALVGSTAVPTRTYISSGAYTGYYTIQANLNVSVSASTTYWLVTFPGFIGGYLTSWYSQGSTTSTYAGGKSRYLVGVSTWTDDTNLENTFDVIISNTPTHSIEWSLSNKKLDY